MKKIGTAILVEENYRVQVEYNVQIGGSKKKRLTGSLAVSIFQGYQEVET